MSFFGRKARGYKAAIRVERYRARAEQLRDDDPAEFKEILSQADGTDAEASARRDPIAYVALLMHAADDAGVFDTQ